MPSKIPNRVLGMLLGLVALVLYITIQWAWSLH